MERVRKTIKDLDYEELLALRKALGAEVKELVEERIRRFENPNLVCPVCATPINPDKDITLHFGPQGLRHRATFDGYDCLHYFLQGKKPERLPEND